MITDINYLEEGFSEEFSSILNDRDPVEETQQEPIKEEVDCSSEEPVMDMPFCKILDDTNNVFSNTIKSDDIKPSTTIFESSCDNSLIYAGVYEEFLQSQIDNELKLNESVMSYIIEAEDAVGGNNTGGNAGGGVNSTGGNTQNNGNNPTNNAANKPKNNRRLQDVVAIKWDSFMKFIDGILDRFWQAMDKIVNSQRNYLEKYKDIILNKSPREDIEYDYTGDYAEGVDRCKNTSLPEFNYERDAPFLRQDGYDALVKDFMSGKNFNYNKDDDLAVQFKNWFIAADRGQTKGKLSNLKMQALYDFLYDSKDLQDTVKKDRSSLSKTRNSLINAVNKELREKGENTQTNQNTNTTTNQTPNGTSIQQSTATNPSAQNASAIEDQINGWLSLNEADNNNNGGNDAGKTGLNISTPASNQKDADGNVTDKNANKPAGEGSTTEQDIKNIVNKWTTISRCFCTGKLTAIQQISKDYMTLIRAHVKSYGGKGTDGQQNQNNEQNNNNAGQNNQQQQNQNNQK